MKRWIAIILALSVIGLAGCAGKPLEASESPEGLVSSITLESSRFPVLNLDSPEAARINAEVREVYDESNYRLEQGWGMDCNADYYAALHGDVLSLIFCRSAMDWPDYIYQTWHLNTKTGEPVQNRELLRIAGWAEEDFADNLRRKINTFYDAQDIDYSIFPANFDEYDFEGMTGFNIQHYVMSAYRAKALGELRDIEALQLYWSNQNHIIAVFEIGSIGGAMCYEVLVDSSLPDDALCEGEYPSVSFIRGNWELLE